MLKKDVNIVTLLNEEIRRVKELYMYIVKEIQDINKGRDNIIL